MSFRNAATGGKDSKQIYNLKYWKFDAVELAVPVDWAMDPFGVLNWRHHLLSLRWIKGEIPLPLARAFLTDFHCFHFVEKRPNNMIGTRYGDHSTALRLESVQNLRSEFISSGDLATANLCEQIMREDIATLLSPQVYRAGHNHGVIADIALLTAIRELDSFEATTKDLIVRRGLESQAALFDEHGITREHSISYQEYNYPLVMQFLELIEARSERHHLADATRTFLTYFTRRCGQYFPFGDSFRKPNIKIRNAHPEIDPWLDTIEQLGEPKNRLYCTSGFFAYVRIAENQRIHFIAVASWNSSHHKHDDDLSFCLEIDDEMIFDDPGYTEAAGISVINALRSATSHSVVTVVEHPYCSRTVAPTRSTFIESIEHDDGFCLLGKHERVPGITITRNFSLLAKTLTIVDGIHVDSGAAVTGQHSFVLAPNLSFETKDDGLHIRKDERLIGVLRSSETDGNWSATTIPYVGSDRTAPSSTTRLTYTAPAKTAREFHFLFL